MSILSSNRNANYLFFALCAIISTASAFTISSTPLTAKASQPIHKKISRSTTTSLYGTKSHLEKGDRVLLVGPGFLQLNIAKALKEAGLIPMIIAPQTKIDNFAQFVNDDSIMKEADIGIPDEKGTVAGVVFCSEEAVYGANLVQTMMEADGTYVDPEGPTRTVACVPISNAVNKNKGMGWMPIFNNDKNEKKIWSDFVTNFQTHPISSTSRGTILRYGNLWGGSVDGPSSLENLGLDECIYKMSLENYRDLRERSFDRFRLGAQILAGDDINPRPGNQDKLEKDAIKKDEDIEVFRIQGGYPQQDAACRHTVAQAVVQALMRPTRGEFEVVDASSKSVPKEFTVLSKATLDLPTTEEWDELFRNPGPAKWPDPTQFDPSAITEELMNRK